MNKKIYIILITLLLLAFSAFSAYAYEREGIAIGTFGLGFNTISGNNNNTTSIALGFDLDLISKTGIAVTLGNMISFEMEAFIYNLPYFGLGYRYVTDKWDLGFSVLAVYYAQAIDAFITVKINGGYWITDSLGLTLTGMYGVGPGGSGLSLFNFRTGISVRL